MAARVTDTALWLRRSSTLRLTLILSALFALGLAATVIVTLSLGRSALIGRIDATLEGLAASVAIDSAPETLTSVVIRPLTDLDGLPRDFVRLAGNGSGTVHLDDDFRQSEDWRVLITEDQEGTAILIAVPLDDEEETLDLLEEVLIGTALVVVALALATGLGTGLLAERRMRRITGTLSRLASGDLKARTGIERRSDDLDELARQLDQTASDLERLIAQTRHLSASIAHDLRTPLARLRVSLEKLPDSGARSDALEEAARLSAIFDTIMRVARIEATQGTEGFAPVDLDDLARDLAETFGPVIEDAGKHLSLELDAPATIEGDRQMLVQAMANLLQNALVHGGSRVTLFAEGQTLGVWDDGAGVDPEQFGEVLKPMVRLDTARASEGSGLGLALVKAVADRHGAALTLSPATPHGLRVAMTFADL